MRVTRNEIVNFFYDEIKSWSDKFIKSNRELNRGHFHIGYLDRQRLWGLMTKKINHHAGEGIRELAICDEGNGNCTKISPPSSLEVGVCRTKKGFMLDKNLNFICHMHHNKVFFGKEEIIELVYGEKVIHWTQRNNPVLHKKSQQIEKRLARKCYGIHPHCSICGQCHKNARTHDRGH